MDTDRNLLFGALTVQAELVDDGQLTEACTAWSAGEGDTLADVMVERGLITQGDRDAVERILDRKVQRRGGDVAGTLAATLGGPARPGATQADAAATNETQPMAPEPGGHVVLSAIGVHPSSGPERYTRTRLHATGGIGRVWLARDSSFGREVALKEIRPERGANEVVWSRFLEEARITGQLEHPGIVPVYEMGTGGEDSGPFYTMRFVKGRTLLEATHDYHKARAAGAATPRDFVALLDAFVGVCNAVAYAHSRGVIHRDLKGQNIVLGNFGEVIVLDWGLAKIVGTSDASGDEPATLTDDGNPRFQTVAGRALGTPAYMPPEQAAGRLDVVDQLSDVYGLGAILYEILTGRAPFDGSKTADILRRVIEEEPSRPRALVPEAPPALEAVCLKAMAKKQTERYPSVTALADDVRRWIADEPVSAFPEPWTQRFGRWAKRHRTAVSTAAALLITATVALAVATVLIRRERNEALAQRNEARTQRRVARSAVDEMYTEVAEKWLEDHLDPVQKEFLEKALAYYETFAGEAAAEPAVREEQGRAYHRMGEILYKLGRGGDAEKADPQTAMEVLGKLSDDFPEEPGPRQHLAAARTSLGVLVAGRGDSTEAEGLFRKSLAALEPLGSAAGAPAATRLDLARAHKGLADLLRVQSKHEAAETSYRRAAEILKALPEGRDDFTPRQLLAATRDRLGKLYNDTGRYGEAAATYARGLEAIEPLVARYPTLPRLREALVNSLRSVGLIEQKHRRPRSKCPASAPGPGPGGRRAAGEGLPAPPRVPPRPGQVPPQPRSVPLGPGRAGRGRTPLSGRLADLRGADRRGPRLAPVPPRPGEGLQQPQPAPEGRRQGRRGPGGRRPRHRVGPTDDRSSTAPRTCPSIGRRWPRARRTSGWCRRRSACSSRPRSRSSIPSRSTRGWRPGSPTSPTIPGGWPGRCITGPISCTGPTRKSGTSLLIAPRRRSGAGPRDRASRLARRARAFARAAADRQEGERASRRAVSLRQGLADKFPKAPEYRLALGESLNTLVELRPADAEDVCRRAVALYRGLVAEDPGKPDYRKMLAVVDHNLGGLLAAADRPSEAEAAFAEAAVLFDALALKVPGEVLLKSYLGQSLAGIRARDPLLSPQGRGFRPPAARAVRRPPARGPEPERQGPGGPPRPLRPPDEALRRRARPGRPRRGGPTGDRPRPLRRRARRGLPRRRATAGPMRHLGRVRRQAPPRPPR